MKRFIKISVCIILVVFLCFSALCVGAEEYKTDYIIDNGKNIPIPQTYTFSHRIDSILSDGKNNRYFDQPSDLKLDKEGNLYVADTKNNRVVKMTADGKLIKIYTEADGLLFNEPKGVFAAKDGTLFIADTGNQRIVRLDKDGKLLKVFGKPEASELSDITVYSPSKIAFSEYGELYVLMGENIMMLDEENVFRGYIGQTKIGYDFIEALLRKIASDVQKKSIQKRMASAYDNIYLGSDNLIYAVNRDTTEGQIKVINSVGNNIYRKISSVAETGQTIGGYISGFLSGNVIRKSFSFGERINGEAPLFSGICVDSLGIVTAVESQSGKLYQYDRSGKLLTVFGGLGENNGQLTLAGSMCVDESGNIYVLDISKGSIIVFSPTEFIKTVHKAVTAYYNGDYKEAEKYYGEILKVDATYPLAHEGLADVAYKEEELADALEGYRKAGDRVKYSNAFTQYRYDFIKSNFFVVFIASAVLIVGLFLLISFVARKSKKVVYDLEYHSASIDMKNGFWTALSMLFRPARTIDAVKTARGRVKTGSAWIILALVFITRIIFIYTVHYPLQDTELADVNLVLEFFTLIVPILTWVMASYLISSQLDGEATLTECFVCSVYSIVPYIAVNLLAAALSHIMSQNETGFFALMVNGVTVWVLILLISTVQRTNDYSGMRTLAVCIISVIAVVLIWFIVLFGYSLVVRFALFFKEIYEEIQIAIG